MLIRPFEIADLETIHTIETESFSNPWSAENLAEEGLGHSYAKIFVAVTEDRPIGYVGLRIFPPDGEITNIAVSSQFRRNGVGHALVSFVKDFCRENSVNLLHLEVRRGNVSALSLYEKEGFLHEGIRKDYYEKPREDALLMTCPLS